MNTNSVTPSIEVSIGRELRLYHAFVTTAPPRFDAPATLTLYAAPLSDLSGMAADPVALDSVRANTLARLVLVDGSELGWQRARYRQPSTFSHQPIRYSSAWTPCSTACGPALGRRGQKRNS